MTTPRMQFSFPVVAQVRKGTPKKKIIKDGRDVMIQGDDLQDKFRIVFFPGAEEYRALFTAGHPECAQLRSDPQAANKPILVTRLHAMMPFAKVFDSLEIWNEAYQAGRLVVRATDTQVITRRDPLTGEYLVRDGQPYEAYDPAVKKAVTYERNGKTFSLPVRTSVRLKLFLPELGRMVAFELKSTSYYDALNLRQQLGAIQVMADMLNNGIAGGIPFWVFRRSQEVCWNKPDGSAQRVQKWLVNIEIDAEWVAAATRRMAGFALTGQQIAGFLQPTMPIAGDEDPTHDLDDEEDGDVIDQDPNYEPESQSHPPVEPPVVEQPEKSQAIEKSQPAQAAAAAPADPEAIVRNAAHDANGTLVRPMAPETLRAALALKVKKIGRRIASNNQVGLVAMLIEQGFAGPDAEKIRHSVTLYLIGVESLKDASGAQIAALLDWLNPSQRKDSGEYFADPTAAKELSSVWTASCEAAGQQRLF